MNFDFSDFIKEYIHTSIFISILLVNFTAGEIVAEVVGSVFLLGCLVALLSSCFTVCLRARARQLQRNATVRESLTLNVSDVTFYCDYVWKCTHCARSTYVSETSLI